MNRPASKFSGFLDAVQSSPPEDDTPMVDTVPTKAASTTTTTSGGHARRGRGLRNSPTSPPRDPVLAADTPRRRGRPSGKRSDPAFDQVTAYIRRQTYRDVRIALLTQGRGQEFSELVEDLLADWLRKKQ